MTWFRCDDQLGDHPKVLALDEKTLPAMGLWLLCGVYSSKRLTDGFVPSRLIQQLGGSRLVKDLERAGLFEKTTGGWTMHDYLEWNPSREEVLRKRAERKAAGMAGAKATWMAKAKATAIDPAEHGPEQMPSKSNGSSQAPYPVPVSEVLTDVLSAREASDFVEPWQLFEERTKRKATQKVRDWLEDLHARFSRRELLAAMQSTPDPKGTDWLKKVDAFLEGAA